MTLSKFLRKLTLENRTEKQLRQGKWKRFINVILNYVSQYQRRIKVCEKMVACHIEHSLITINNVHSGLNYLCCHFIWKFLGSHVAFALNVLSHGNVCFSFGFI